MWHDEESARRLSEPLKYPSLVQRPRATEVFRIWRRPSFEPHASWTLIEDAQAYYVRRIALVASHAVGPQTWDSYAAEAPVPRQIGDEILGELRIARIVVGLETDHRVVLDGTYHGFDLLNRSHERLSVSWWGPAPSAWGDLRAVWLSAVTAFEPLLPESTVTLCGSKRWLG